MTTTAKKRAQERTRWSLLPKWAYAHGLRKNVHFRAEGDIDYTEAAQELPDVADNINDAQVITSRVEFPENSPELNMHRPILDIDFPAQLIPSSTEGHFHLYLDKPMPWSTYKKLLRALAEAGIIEGGYARASEARKYTAVRLPWVHKDDAPDQERPEPEPLAEDPAERAAQYERQRAADPIMANLRQAYQEQSSALLNSFLTPRTTAASAVTYNRAPAAPPIHEQGTEVRNRMGSPITYDGPRQAWRSASRSIPDHRLRHYFGDRYHELFERNPTEGNSMWREAVRREQRRDNENSLSEERTRRRSSPGPRILTVMQEEALRRGGPLHRDYSPAHMDEFFTDGETEIDARAIHMALEHHMLRDLDRNPTADNPIWQGLVRGTLGTRGPIPERAIRAARSGYMPGSPRPGEVITWDSRTPAPRYSHVSIAGQDLGPVIWDEPRLVTSPAPSEAPAVAESSEQGAQ